MANRHEDFHEKNIPLLKEVVFPKKLCGKIPFLSGTGANVIERGESLIVDPSSRYCKILWKMDLVDF